MSEGCSLHRGSSNHQTRSMLVTTTTTTTTTRMMMMMMMMMMRMTMTMMMSMIRAFTYITSWLTFCDSRYPSILRLRVKQQPHQFSFMDLRTREGTWADSFALNIAVPSGFSPCFPRTSFAILVYGQTARQFDFLARCNSHEMLQRQTTIPSPSCDPGCWLPLVLCMELHKVSSRVSPVIGVVSLLILWVSWSCCRVVSCFGKVVTQVPTASPVICCFGD